MIEEQGWIYENLKIAKEYINIIERQFKTHKLIHISYIIEKLKAAESSLNVIITESKKSATAGTVTQIRT